MFVLSLEYSMSLLWGPNNNIFLLLSKMLFEGPKQNLKTFRVKISIFLFM